MKKDSLKIFEDSSIRTVWDSENQKWYISIVDVVAVLTQSIDPTGLLEEVKTKA